MINFAKTIPDTSQDLQKKSKTLLLPLSILLAVVSLSATFIYLKISYPELFRNTVSQIYDKVLVPTNKQAAKDQIDQLIVSPIPTHSPYPLIPDTGAAGTFKVSHNAELGPKITNIIIDPLNATLNDEINITLTLSHPSAIKKVSANIETDSDPININFKKDSRVGNSESWSTTFQLTSPILYKYIYNFSASDDTNSSSLPMGLRN